MKSNNEGTHEPSNSSDNRSHASDSSELHVAEENMEQEGVVSHVENRALTGEEISLLAGFITEEPDHYTVLGVNRDASNEDIHSAYRLAVEYFHPLKSRKLTESDSVLHWKLSSAFLRIEEAFTVLSRPSRREIYDDNLS